MTPTRRIIDTHQHVLWHQRDIEGLIADMDLHRIEYAWLLSWEIHPQEDAPGYHGILNPLHFRADGTHRGIPLEDLIAARDRYPTRFLLGFCPHPLIGDASLRLKAAAAIHRVQVCGEWKFRIPFDDPRCINLFRTAGELGLPVVLHLDIPFIADGQGGSKYVQAWYGGTVENLERALIACPHTTFIGHAPGFWREISRDADQRPEFYPEGCVTAPGKVHRLLEKYDHLYADLSAGSGLKALSRDPEHAREFLRTFSEKLLFARDYYGSDLQEFLDSLQLDAQTQARIFHQNAEKLVLRHA